MVESFTSLQKSEMFVTDQHDLDISESADRQVKFAP